MVRQREGRSCRESPGSIRRRGASRRSDPKVMVTPDLPWSSATSHPSPQQPPLRSAARQRSPSLSLITICICPGVKGPIGGPRRFLSPPGVLVKNRSVFCTEATSEENSFWGCERCGTLGGLCDAGGRGEAQQPAAPSPTGCSAPRGAGRVLRPETITPNSSQCVLVLSHACAQGCILLCLGRGRGGELSPEQQHALPVGPHSP